MGCDRTHCVVRKTSRALCLNEQCVSIREESANQTTRHSLEVRSHRLVMQRKERCGYRGLVWHNHLPDPSGWTIRFALATRESN